MEEGRELFWDSYAAGKLFAQRQSMWDAAFTVIGSRDRDLGLLLRLLLQTLFNFFTGMTVRCGRGRGAAAVCACVRWCGRRSRLCAPALGPRRGLTAPPRPAVPSPRAPSPRHARSVFVFLFRLPALILSFQAPLWSGAAFFCLAGVAAVSVIAAYLGLLFGAGATATYATVWIVAQQQQGRLAGGGPPRQRLEGGSSGRVHEE